MRTDQNSDRPDQRRAARAETDIEGVVASASRQDIKCRISNVSRIGACAVSNVAFPEMAHVKIRFQVDEADGSSRSISCEAAVVRSQRRVDGEYDVGLFFTAIKPEDRAAIDKLVARAAPIPTA